MFWLFGSNKVSAERESMLALLVANNRRLHLKDGARILGLEPTTLRMRLTRAAKDGWTKHSGINHWSLSDRVTTELEMLITAVSDRNLAGWRGFGDSRWLLTWGFVLWVGVLAGFCRGDICLTA